MRQWFQSILGEDIHLNPDSQRHMFERLSGANLVVHVGTVSAGQVVAIPPGFLVALAVVGDDAATGVCKGFSDFGDATAERLSALMPSAGFTW